MEVARAIGRLEGAMDGIAKTIAEEAARAAASRQAIYGRVDQLQAQVGSLTTTVNGVSEAVAEMQPPVAQLGRDRLLAKGMLLGAGAGGAGFTLGFQKIVDFFLSR